LKTYNNEKRIKNLLKNLFESWSKQKAESIIPLAESGSYREYFRISGKDKAAVGVFGNDKKENAVFITFTKHFLKKGLNVSSIYKQNLKQNIYLLEDLGNNTLFSLVQQNKSSIEVIDYYKQSLSHLIKFQVDGNKGLDYSVCYPRRIFDKQSILWDLNYFKYYFLKPLKIDFNEQKLEDDFRLFADHLLTTDTNYFMYRDFQSRNIMLHKNDLYFIDYQGGRKGALQYDVASLLFQAKADLSPMVREELLEFYLKELRQKSNVKRQMFKKYFYSYVLIRVLQTLGAYGFRGLYEKKAHFVQSIPYAIKNLKWLIDNNHLPKKLNELNKVLRQISFETDFGISKKTTHSNLKVTVTSFSYKDRIPVDYTGNGGGFVFDCRSINNPGRQNEYKDLNGKDEEVIRFLEEKSNVIDFLSSVYSIVDRSINNYIERGFKNLMVNFGCTGGQHRSVYCAEKLTEHIKNNFKVYIELNHIQLEKEGLL